MANFKINRNLLPIKAHYFFFMAGMGPILPQTNVFGKQLGISPDVMGLITSVLPLLYILAKPAVGYLIDYFSNARKIIFMIILMLMTLCYAGFYFVPAAIEHKVPSMQVYHFSMDSIDGCRQLSQIRSHESLCQDYRSVSCHISCSHAAVEAKHYDAYLTTYKRIFVGTELEATTDNSAAASTLSSPAPAQRFHVQSSNINYDLCLVDQRVSLVGNKSCDISCELGLDQPDCVFGTPTFWIFVVLMCLGTIGYNVANCVSDATCFDMLGDTQTMKYGAQRVWGTIGFGLSALVAGIAVNEYGSDAVNSIAPALFVMLVFSSLDVFTIRWLKLPVMTSATSIWGEVTKLLRQPTILIFLVFATLAGVFDSFIIYYMFWHLEEVAVKSDHIASIKLIEGCVVAAECLGGEILFFLVSGKILKKIGYVHCLSFCFAMYALRLGLISLITNPWWLVAVEFFMQGPTYALCYTCIVAYASAVSPPGTTATVQGLVAGMDDGVGFAIGSLIGGQAYKRLGGALSFRSFSIGALVVCVAHIMLRPAAKHETMQKTMGNKQPEVEYAIPLEQHKVEASIS